MLRMPVHTARQAAQRAVPVMSWHRLRVSVQATVCERYFLVDGLMFPMVCGLCVCTGDTES